MFTPIIRKSSLNTVRINLPIDTGNLRFNATTEFGNENFFEIRVGGVRANYFGPYLEENPNSIHYKNLDANIIPNILVPHLEKVLNGKASFSGMNDINETLTQQLANNNVNRRNKTLLRSLQQENVTPYEYLYTTNR